MRRKSDEWCFVERSSEMPLLRLAYYNQSALAKWRKTWYFTWFSTCFCLPLLCAPALQEATYSVLADSQLQRERSELERVRELVGNGTLPRAKLKEAEEKVADAEDQDTLAKTLYGDTPVEEMTVEAAAFMKAAAERRIARQQKVVDDRRTFLESGVIARTEVETAEAELQTRRQVLDLVNTRLRLLEDLKHMAESERAAEKSGAAGLPNMTEAIARGAVTRFNGTANFAPAKLASLSSQYQKKFGAPMPVSAVGETAVHRALGLDHRDRVDVALSPDSREGLWLRQFLERLKFPYLAFRSAVAGAATAPHIHIGPGSTRLASSRR